jgi:hypothetical protein
MKAKGFASVNCGPDGPSAWAIAEQMTAAWNRARNGAMDALPKWPMGSIGYAFDRYRRTDAWAKKAPSTREEWEARAWPWIAKVFGDVNPKTVSLEDVEALRKLVEKKISPREAHRVIKIWRALWQVMAAFQYCDKSSDPSFGIRNAAVPGRKATWGAGEAARLVKQAWRRGYPGLAAGLAVMWDTGWSPVDVRTLTSRMQTKDKTGTYFNRPRAKTGSDAIGTITRRTGVVLDAYLASLGVELVPEAPIFRNRSGAPYSSDTMGDDFRDIRGELFPGDDRKMMDFRRSASTEALAGNADAGQISAKLGNSLSESKMLQETYLPNRVVVVRQADEARRLGRKRLRENET